MIPMMNIIAWSNIVPWAELRQVEQDLIISRAIVDLFSDPFLREQLLFRGGTSLNKLHFPAPIRYSEDIAWFERRSGQSVPSSTACASDWNLGSATRISCKALLRQNRSTRTSAACFGGSSR
jgi:hypothetical protein